MSYSSQDWNLLSAARRFAREFLPLDVYSESSASARRGRSPSPNRRVGRSRSPRGRIVQAAQAARGRSRSRSPSPPPEQCDPNPPKIVQPYSERLPSYQAIQAYLSQARSPNDICALSENIFPCKKRIGSASVYGLIYRLYNKVQRQRGNAPANMIPTDFIVKVMEDNRENQGEAVTSQEFSSLVESNVIPNFVMCWSDHQCKNKCSFIDLPSMNHLDWDQYGYWSRIKAKSCYMLFAELFHGDMKNFHVYLREFLKPQRTKIVLSFIAQFCIVGCLLDRYKKSHNDLHTGNVLFKSYSDDPNSAFVYHLKNSDIAIRHQSHLFAMWDVSFLNQRGTKDYKDRMSGMYSDLYRLFSLMSYKFADKIEKDGIERLNPDNNWQLYRALNMLSEWCLDMHKENIKREALILKKYSLEIDELFNDILPSCMKASKLLNEWNEVVQINPELSKNEITEEFDLTADL